MTDKIEELASQCKEYYAVDESIAEMEFNYRQFAKLIIDDTLAAARAGMQFGPSMEEAVYRYFGIKD